MTLQFRTISVTNLRRLGVGLTLIASLAGATGCESPVQSFPVAIPSSPATGAPPLVTASSRDPAPLAGTTPPVGAGTPAENEPDLVARVNGQPIYARDFERQIGQYEQALAAQGYDLTTAEGQVTLEQTRRQVLEAMVEQVLIGQAATTAGIVVTDTFLESKVQETIALGQDRQQFEAWLAANNMTLDEFKRSLYDQLLTGQMFEHVTAGLLTTADQVHLRHIQVGDESTARDILAQLQGGANFAALAQTYSLDESTRANGGDLGWFPRGLQLISAEIEQVAFELAPGQISDVIPSPFGYHIIKVENRQSDRPLTPEMLLALKSSYFDSWLAQLKAEAHIERFLDM
jgi:hypothetical protein